MESMLWTKPLEATEQRLQFFETRAFSLQCFETNYALEFSFHYRQLQAIHLHVYSSSQLALPKL
jgi:hypothetical protein